MNENDAHFKMQELESLNKSVVKEELMRQLEGKMAKINQEIVRNQQKLTEVVKKIEEQEAKGQGHKNKELMSKRGFYSNQVRHYEGRRDKLSQDYQRLLEKPNDDGDGLMEFFSHQ